MHSLREFNDRRANKRGLKAAQGKSKAPKGYKPDTASRDEVSRVSKHKGMDKPTRSFDYKSEGGFSEFDNSRGPEGRKTAFSKAALVVEGEQGREYDIRQAPQEAKDQVADSPNVKSIEYSGWKTSPNYVAPATNKETLTQITGRKAK